MRLPNTATIEALREARAGEEVTTYASLDELKAEERH